MTTFESKTTLRPGTSLGVTLRPPPVPPVAQPETLMKAVQSAVLATDEESLQRVARADAGVAYQPRTLLALLTYCYAREIYGSAAVEDVMRRDVSFRELCHNEFPDARLIRRFRRENREALQRCLTDALHFLAMKKMEAGIVTSVKYTHLVEEANRRTIMAMFIDNMELDSD